MRTLAGGFPIFVCVSAILKGKAFRGMTPFFLALLTGFVLVLEFHPIATILPNLMR